MPARSRPAAETLVVIGLQGDLARAALVTLIGLANWRVHADGRSRVDVVRWKLVLHLLADQGGK
jgi:hypothetical protein